jgi:hypothetical protein
MLIPAIKRHRGHFGRPPRKVATDRGFWSSKNEKDAHSLGVKRVSIPFRGGKLSEGAAQVAADPLVSQSATLARWRRGTDWNAQNEIRPRSLHGTRACTVGSADVCLPTTWS